MKKLLKLLMELLIFQMTIQECLKGCLKCNNNDQCLFCDPLNQYMLEATTCNQRTLKNCLLIDLQGNCLACSSSYAKDTASKNCVKLLEDTTIANCATYSTVGVCLFCQSGFTLKSGKCESSTQSITNCLILNPQDPTQCLKCKSNYVRYIDNKSCVEEVKESNCLSYTTLQCGLCKTGMIIDKNKYMDQIFQYTSLERKDQILGFFKANTLDDIDVGFYHQCRNVEVANCQTPINYYECEVCDKGYFLDEFKKCVPFPKEIIPGCNIYLQSDKCLQCDEGYYLASPNECTKVDSSDDKCVKFDPSSSQIKCLQCNNEHYLDQQSICRKRTEASTFEECEERNQRQDQCSKCVKGKQLTSDLLKCLPEIFNCLVYQISNKETTELSCKRCIDKWVYIKTQSKCLQGQIENCDQYNLDNKCEQCEQGFYKSGDVCVPQEKIARCSKFSYLEAKSCVQCEQNTFLFNRNNGCLAATKISSCAEYSNTATCSKCEIDFELKENQCQRIVSPQNCRVLDKLVSTNCTKCHKEFVIKNSDYSCILPQDYFTDQCQSHNVDGEQLLSNIVCHYCKENALIMDYVNTYLCMTISSLQNALIPNLCLKLKISDSGAYTCMQCERGYKLENNKCVLSCNEVNTVLLTHKLEYSNFLTATSSFGVSVLQTDICESKTNQTHFQFCSIAQPNLFQENVTATTNMQNYSCVKCMSEKYKVVKKNMVVITDDPEITPTGTSSISNYPGLMCIELNNNNVAQLVVVANCQYYYENKALVGAAANLKYGCMRCQFGFQGVVNSNGYIESCESMNTSCNKEFEMREGITFTQDKIAVLTTSWSSYFTCTKCLNDSEIPFVAISNVANEMPSVGGNMKKQDQSTFVSIDCKNVLQSSHFGTTETINFPTNCALGVYNSKVAAVAFVTSGNITKTPTNNSTAVYCVACKSKYKPLYADLSNNDQYRNLVYSCSPMLNCESSVWFNACSQCKPNHVYQYETATMTVDFTDCYVYDDVNCYAFYTTQENTKKCQFCLNGYTLNIDGLCELISAPKCQTTQMDFRSSYQLTQNQSLGLLLQLSPGGTGCNKCFTDYVAVFQKEKQLVCTYQEYIQKKIYVTNSKLITNCKNYSYLNEAHICKVCATGYTPSTDGKCYLSSNQLFCVEMRGSINCNKCVKDYVIVNGACQKAAIKNCIKYNNNSLSTKQLCSICDKEYYKSADETECLKGLVSNCDILTSEKACQKCSTGYFITKLKDNMDFCFPLESELNCDEIDSTQLTSNKIIQCNKCAKDHAISSTLGLYNKTICMTFGFNQKCNKYDLNETDLQESTLQCIQCKDSFYLDSEAECVLRNPLGITNCIQYSLTSDTCVQCGSGYFVSQNGVFCEALPSGIKGCIEYKSATNCVRCSKNLYLSENQCVPVEEAKLIDKCDFYNIDQTCLVCTTGYAVDNAKCVKATAQNCLEYTSKIACSKCYPRFGFQSINSVVHCVAKTDEFCLESEEFHPFKCLICDINYYPDAQGVCIDVKKETVSCARYDSSQICTKCLPGFVLSLDKSQCIGLNSIKKINDPNCTDSFITQPKCNICSPGYFQDTNGTCKQCTTNTLKEGCFLCDPVNQANCIICDSGFYMNKSGKCIKVASSTTTTTTTPDQITPVKGDARRLFSWMLFFSLIQ